MRRDSIQCLRALAALTVLFGHVIGSIGHGAYPRPEALDFLILHITSPLCHAGVDLFFVVSGAIMFLVTRDTQTGMGSAVQFLHRRALRIYPLLWVVLVAYSIQQGAWDGAAEFALINPSTVLGPAWTLTYEVRFYLMVGIALALVPNAWRFVAVGVAIVSAVLLGVLPPLMLEFVFGALVAAAAVRTDRFAVPCVVIAFALLAAALVWVYDPHAVASFRTWAFGIPAALLLYGAMGLERRITWPHWVVAAGDMSYSIYLWHFPVISVLLSFWPRGTWAGLLTYYAAAFMLVAVVSALSWRLIEQPAIGLGRALRTPQLADQRT